MLQTGVYFCMGYKKLPTQNAHHWPSAGSDLLSTSALLAVEETPTRVQEKKKKKRKPHQKTISSKSSKCYFTMIIIIIRIWLKGCITEEELLRCDFEYRSSNGFHLLYFVIFNTHKREKTRVAVKDTTQALDISRVLADFACSTAGMIEKYRTKLWRS